MSNKNKVVFGIILVIIGIILLGRSLDVFYISFGELFHNLIPVAFIILGIWLIFRKKKRENQINVDIGIKTSSTPGIDESFAAGEQSTKANSNSGATYYSSSNYEQAQFTQSASTDESGKLKYDKALGDISLDFNNVNIQNVEISMFIGDLELKLHGGKLADGLNRIIISSFIGDIRIFAPKDMAIFTHCSNFVGDIEVLGKKTSGFGSNIDSQTANYDSASKKLYIACNSFIGDIKIYEL
ncbi:MAG: cell wall-active antibiotics response protein LiaF [Candidatus Zixiibacteriota bacterium]